ncbi:zeta toxin family protein [Streptomyces sp. NPDC001777]|uniref:zeta toxin family protein n=1 Tax=Streptomyces sp. NPDC001777 TaxID=3364608 RepID=UPI0036906202
MRLPVSSGAVARVAGCSAVISSRPVTAVEPRGVITLEQAPGVDYHRLSAEEHRWIFDALIAPSLLENITPQERPVAVYVMGQPGSGKTSRARALRRALRGRPVRISGDFFKAAHPDYYDLLRQEPRTAGERIRADYRAWQAMAEAAARERRGDVTIEIAPGSAAGFVEGARAYRRAGYRVELVVLAVRAADSRQGTAVRCADVNRLGGHGRFTTVSGHDRHFAVLADAVAEAEREEVADCVMVWGREGTVLYRNDRTPQGSWTRPARAAEVLLAEQRRPYTSQEAARFWALQRRLRTELPHYRHDIDQIACLARALMPAHLQPRRLAGPAPATRTAGLAQQAPARRLTESPLISENPYALWPYHLHRAIRSAVRDEDQDLAATIGRLRALTATGDFAYFTNIAHHMAACPCPAPPPPAGPSPRSARHGATWSGPGRNTCAPETDPYIHIGPDQTVSGRGR